MNHTERFGFPRLVADIGGTNCRFAVVRADKVVEPLLRFGTVEVAGPVEAIERAIASMTGPRPAAVALALASPLVGDRVSFVNASWSFSIEETAAAIGCPLVLMNDFTAQSYALAVLDRRSFASIGPNAEIRSGTKVVLGPGTGLGVGILVTLGGADEAIASEAGHMTAAAHDERESEIIGFARRRYTHVSWERLVSGPGLSVLHDAVAAIEGVARPERSAAEVVANLDDPICAEAIRAFTGFFGTFTSDVVLAVNALAGAHLVGGVLGHLGAAFDVNAFRARFEDKGRYAELLRDVPIHRIVDPVAAFRGSEYVLARVARGERPSGCVIA